MFPHIPQTIHQQALLALLSKYIQSQPSQPLCWQPSDPGHCHPTAGLRQPPNWSPCFTLASCVCSKHSSQSNPVRQKSDHVISARNPPSLALLRGKVLITTCVVPPDPFPASHPHLTLWFLATQASLLFLPHATHTPASKALDLLFPLSGSFPLASAWLILCFF